MSQKKITKILFFTLSNLGDVFLTLPVLDALRERYPDAQITAMIGPRPREVLERSRCVDTLIIYDKHMPLRRKVRLFLALRAERFDIVIDFRNSLYGALLPARFRTSPFVRVPRRITHMYERNLYRFAKALGSECRPSRSAVKAFFYEQPDREHVESLLFNAGVRPAEKILLISHATAGSTRKWDEENFAAVCSRLGEAFRIILVGAREHGPRARRIIEKSGARGILDLTGLTSLRQLAYLMTKAACVLTCDTGTTHIASYMDAPVVALFGPGDEGKYAPWSGHSEVITREIFCRPCQDAQCRYENVECMNLITADEVVRRIESFVHGSADSSAIRTVPVRAQPYRRILVCRTDRIGDLVLSTPVFEALRQRYPNAYIGVIVAAGARDIVAGNPFIDRVIVYDKRGAHKSGRATLRFVLQLRAERFDAVLVLHPTNRMHWITFFSGIPRRIGYDRKCGFLLTDRVIHRKQDGTRHESEYNFDLVRILGVEGEPGGLFMPTDPQAEQWADRVMGEAGFLGNDRVLAIHPGASCPSKIWNARRFARVADVMAQKHGFKIVVITGPEDVALGREFLAHLPRQALDLSGKTSIAQLASVLRRCRMLISNDSGPVHLAAAVGSAVVAIFGRKQDGLSVRRWGPRGARTAVVQKDVGCIECFAHRCRKQFACLEAIEPEDVIKAAEGLL